MRGSRKLVAAVVAAGALLSAGITSIPTGSARTTQVDALRQQRAALVAQLASLLPARDNATSALGAAENAFAGAQTQLLTAQNQLTALNARLLSLNSQIVADDATIAQAKQTLAGLARQSYESTTTDSWVAAVLSAKTFGQAMDRLTGTSHVAEQVRNLQDQLRAKQQAIQDEKAELQKDMDTSVRLEGQLSTDSNALMVLVTQRNAAMQAASAPARAVASQIAQIDQQIAAAIAPPPRQSHGGASASCGDRFSFGQCTWYVATRRCIPWTGNADEWFYAAANYGYPEGRTPEVGAVVVFWRGGDGASRVGHVAYVEAVGPAGGLPVGSFRMSEMNFNGGWDRVSYRVLPNNSGGIQGFIYQK